MSGDVQVGFEPVREAFLAAQAGDEGGAQLAVYHRGELVVDLWAGRDPIGGADFSGESITVLMSVTKGLVATCANMLRERGQLDVDRPVVEYWPEFTGKDEVTVGHLLSHRAGLSDFDPDDGIGMAELIDWDRCVGSLAAMAPLWTPGAAFKYHAFTWGFPVGEVIRRVTGMSVGSYFAQEVAGPLGLDLWIGLPSSQDHRFVPEFVRSPAQTFDEVAAPYVELGIDLSDRLVRAAIGTALLGGVTVDGTNSPAARRAEFPSAGGIGNARSLARMYAATIAPVDGVRLLAPETVESAIRPLNDDLDPPSPLDLLPGQVPIRMGLGFERPRAGTPMLGPGSFGHAGAGGRLGFADPDAGVAVGYVCTNMLWDVPRGADDRWVPWMAALHKVLD